MFYCGLDFGTTNTKAVLFDEQMMPCRSVSLSIGSKESSDWLSAEIWLDQLYEILEYFQKSDVLKGEKIVLSIAAQGGSFVIINKHNQPISPAYLWTGKSSQAAVSQLMNTFDKGDYYRKTGWEPQGWLTVCKLKDWLSVHGSEIDQVSKVTTVPDYISAQLTGRAVTDITNAQMTGMFDFNIRKWDPDILRWSGCRIDWLSEVIDSPQVFTDDINIHGVNISIATSSHDQYAVMQAAGVNAPGDFMLGTGTAWVLNGKSDQPLYDHNRFTIHPGRDLGGSRYGYIATLGAIGQGFEKLMHSLGLNYTTLMAMEKELAEMNVPPQSVEIDIAKGIVAPAAETKQQAIRWYKEATGAKVRYLLEKLGKAQVSKKIIMTGGAAGSYLWPAIIAGICNIPVEAVRCNELTAYGAAIYAGMAVSGKCSNRLIPNVQCHRFEPVMVDKYEEWYQDYQKPMLERMMNNEL
jgi:sugar (pentulose or hexulose) kinase